MIQRCWMLWNVNIGIAFSYSYTDLVTRLWRYFGFISFTALILRPVTSLGHQEGEEFSESGPHFLNYVQYLQTMSNTFF